MNINLNNGTNKADALKSLEALMGTRTVLSKLPAGEYDTTFLGFTIDNTKMPIQFIISFQLNDTKKIEKDTKRIDGTEKKAASVGITLDQIARQLGILGDYNPADLQDYIGKNLKVWSHIPVGQTTLCYSYQAPRTIATESTVEATTIAITEY